MSDKTDEWDWNHPPKAPPGDERIAADILNQQIAAAEARGYERGKAESVDKAQAWDKAVEARREGFLRCREEAAKVCEHEDNWDEYAAAVADQIRDLNP